VVAGDCHAVCNIHIGVGGIENLKGRLSVICHVIGKHITVNVGGACDHVLVGMRDIDVGCDIDAGKYSCKRFQMDAICSSIQIQCGKINSSEGAN